MQNVWIIGAGGMAQDYINVLKSLEVDFSVIGRSLESSKSCEKASKCQVVTGGLESFLSKNPRSCSHAIVAVGIENLYETTKQLLEYGIKKILVEKPGGLYLSEFKELIELSAKKDSKVFIAYNRRFYASVIEAQKIIAEDGGVKSFNFEFTEWAHVIEPLKKADGVKEKWFLGNSTHVVDLAFFLGAKPKEISSFTSSDLDWHPSASNFSGAGISESGALFNYQANWKSAGRWSVELLTNEHRLIFRPMEKLYIQKRGTIAQTLVESIDYSLDDEYKPGLFVQTEKFIRDDFSNMCSLEEQYKAMDIYNKMANYKS